jgi:hypothetical protein
MGCCGQNRATSGPPKTPRKSLAAPKPLEKSSEAFALVGNVYGELVLPSGAVHKNLRPGVVIRVKREDLADPRIVEHGQKSSATYRAFR